MGLITKSDRQRGGLLERGGGGGLNRAFTVIVPVGVGDLPDSKSSEKT